MSSDKAVSLDQQARWRSQEGDESAGACYCDWISLSNFNHKVLDTQPPLFRAAMASILPSQYDFNHRIPEVILLVRYLAHSSLTRSTSKSLRMLLIKQGTSFDIFVTSADAVCNRCFTARDALECLRQVDAPTLNKVNVNVSNSGFFGTCVFVPVVDGTLITERPTELLRLGRVNGVSIFLVFPKSTSWISFNRRYFLL